MRCPRCQTENPPQAKFCLECAAPLTARVSSPDDYTPNHLARRILDSKTSLEGERKQVTVLFADLKGSMELLSDRDPEEARSILDPVLERMMEAVHRYEGTVNQVMGDGIMALFGAPLAHEDHAVRACYAALRIQEQVKRYAEEARRTHGLNVQIRVGLNSGEVVVRAIGSDLHMDYTAVGQTTHLAARMEQLAEPGTILVGPTTVRLAGAYVDLKRRGLVPVKGLTDPVDVCELRGAAPMRSRFQVRAGRGLNRFIGRDRELEQLREALALAADGHGQVVAVVGEPGIGKSRLLHEFVSSETARWSVIESGAVAHGKSTAYLPVIGLLGACFGIDDEDGANSRREKVKRMLVSLDPQSAARAPALLSLLDVPVDEPEWQRLDAPQRRQRTLEDVTAFVLLLARARPLVVIVEDLHWIDTETQSLLDALVERLTATPVLLLVDYRPEYQDRWVDRTHYRRLRIDALSAERVAEQLDGLLGTDAGLAPLKRMLVERTQGNPLFLEESVQALRETGALTGEPGGYRLTREVTAVEIPATVHAILAARIDRLTPADKRLLQAAAVIGETVPSNLLVAVAGLSEEDARAGLARLQAAEFLYETRLFPDLEYTFKHALTQEVAYGSLLRERRRDLHGRILAAIEHQHTGGLHEHVARLAHHAVRGEVWDKAALYCRQAGLKEAQRFAYTHAVASLEQALSALHRLEEDDDRARQEIDVRLELADILTPIAGFERGRENLREALALTERLGDQRRLMHVLRHATMNLLYLGDPTAGRAAGERALAIAETLGDDVSTAMVALALGHVCSHMGDNRRARDLLIGAARVFDGDLLYERFGRTQLLSVISLNFLTIALVNLGEFDRAEAAASKALQVAETDKHPQPLTLHNGFEAVGRVAYGRGDFERFIPLIERVGENAKGFQIQFSYFRVWLSEAYARCGRLAEAVALLDELTETKEVTNTTVLGTLHTRIAGVQLLLGRLDRAKTWATAGLELGRERGSRSAEALALHVLADVAAHPGVADFENAENLYRAAMAIADELGMRPLVAHCHLGLGALYRMMGRSRPAREHLATAAAMYSEMGMRFWPEQVEAELRYLSSQAATSRPP